MRVGIISDVHGNLLALEAVLADIGASRRLDGIICLGDVAVDGPKPRETVRRLMQLDLPMVLGNTDDWSVVEEQPLPGEEDEEGEEGRKILRETDAWSIGRLPLEERRYLQTFRKTIETQLGPSLVLLCYHGSPRNYMEKILPTTSEEELKEMLGGHERVTVFAGGHTHQQMLRRYRDKVLLNPGSVGLPYDALPDGRVRNPPWAEYAVVEVGEGSDQRSLCVELKRVPVDATEIRRQLLESGMPHPGFWAAGWTPP
jgi:putative phosphoesterase